MVMMITLKYTIPQENIILKIPREDISVYNTVIIENFQATGRNSREKSGYKIKKK